MSLPTSVERAVGLCYEAALAGQAWRAALDHLARALGADGCNLFPCDPADRPLNILQSPYMERLSEYWAKNRDWVVDVYSPRAGPLARDGYRAILQAQIFSEDEIAHSRFHQEIARPAGCLHWAASCFAVEEIQWALPIFRRSDPFTRDEAKTIAAVSEHLARIVSLAQKTSFLLANSEIAAFDKIGSAAMLVDWSGRIIRANHAAATICCEDFHVRDRKLQTTDPRAQLRLERLLAAVGRRANPIELNASPVIVVRNARPWLLIEASPVSGVAKDTFGGACVILVITDLLSARTTNASLLKLAFGLTAAEARLAAAICEGTELYAAAERFHVSRETVRSQLRSIFGKIGVRRQAELVSRLNSLRSLAKTH